jgi:hypothetical protein
MKYVILLLALAFVAAQAKPEHAKTLLVADLPTFAKVFLVKQDCEGTPCDSGCCPIFNAVCCPDGIYCATNAIECP